jgi:poly(3-hydroxybutyrate) depolymerase
MYKGLWISLALLNGAFVNAQSVNLRGTVSNGGGQPVSGAIVTLMKAGLKDTTGSDGTYSLAQRNTAILPRSSGAGSISLANGVLEIELSEPSPVTIEVFDIKSNLLKAERNAAREAGIFRWDFAGKYPSNQLLIVRASVGGKVSTFRYLPMVSGYSGQAGVTAATGGAALAKSAAAIDSLEVKAPGYAAKTVMVESYDAKLDVSMTSDGADKWGGLHNPPIKSAGCGKPLSLTNGKKTIRSTDQNRTYIIDIPANYDPNKPYLFFYVSHWINGTSEEMLKYHFYDIKTKADAANKSSIFVAPQSDGGTWQQKDHALFDDILASMEENLCLDVTRIFAIGYSFGGMITYSLSTNHQNKIRAGVGIAPANYSIWLPNPKLKEPIAWMQNTGMGDETCRWINNESQKTGAKFIALEKAADNGCEIPSEIPTWKSGNHVTYEFKGCKTGYPVIVNTFNGPHGGAEKARDPGAGDSWVPREAWDFFMRF